MGSLSNCFFSKKGVNGKWKVLVCTNTRLSFVEMIEIYQIRWTIEVFFYAEYIVMQSGTNMIIDNQSIPFLSLQYHFA